MYSISGETTCGIPPETIDSFQSCSAINIARHRGRRFLYSAAHSALTVANFIIVLTGIKLMVEINRIMLLLIMVICRAMATLRRCLTYRRKAWPQAGHQLRNASPHRRGLSANCAKNPKAGLKLPQSDYLLLPSTMNR